MLGRPRSTMPGISAHGPAAATRVRTGGLGPLGIALGGPIAASALVFLSFRQMSLTAAGSALTLSLYSLKVGILKNHTAANDARVHTGLVGLGMVIGALAAGTCLVMVGFLALASAGSVSPSDGLSLQFRAPLTSKQSGPPVTCSVLVLASGV
jgi:hypothetical protein